ncbi:hypothetical protein GR210_27055 [Rhizobium leguminosarum]|uniref:hypothetical protein n=1 Tax=Rhizobium leguminosarum TaxID=384 RepID=UPI0013DB34B3|nr:hypothetical protein [Rhizobium leguminosarum]MBY5317914.1 hypothetical protein [Rhizobium leguminosarum]NEH52441.1 hypothetical protein [Rhizobium leguminosarum]
MKPTAEQDLQTRLQAIRSLGGNDQAFVDATIARNILHEDLGQFEGSLTTYNLDDATRDRLIAHARQDAAHAVMSASSLSKDVGGLKRSINLLIGLMAVLLVIELVRFVV